MKKIITILLLAVTFILAVSCESQEKVKSDIELLRSERVRLQNEVGTLLSNVRILSNQQKEITEDIAYKKAISSGKPVKYILHLKLKQSHFSLDVNDHLKDAMNAIEFQLPVDKEFYDHCNTGTEIVDDFRVGSFIMNGSFGKWKMKVVKKEIQY